METKLFEVRDRGTFIPVICSKLLPSNEAERYLVAMSGYGLQIRTQEKNITYAPLAGGQFTADPYCHIGIARTHTVAHQYISQSWNELVSGDVVDVEFILMETTIKKESQRSV